MFQMIGVNDPKQINNLVQNLRNQFREKTRKYGYKNDKGSFLYNLQVEYSYIINDIQQGPSLMIPKLVSDFHALMRKIPD